MAEVVALTKPAGNVVCDLDGVVYLAGQAVPGAGEALLELEGMGLRLIFVTNNSTRSPAAVAAEIRQTTAYPAHPGQVVTSAQAAVRLLSPSPGSSGPACLVLGGAGIAEVLGQEGVPVTGSWPEAGAVVVGLDWELTYDRLRDACLAVRAGARFVATNVDETFPTPQGEWPGAGAIAAAVRAATGRVPEVAGKPHSPMRDLVRSRLAPGPTWVLGDRPSTDLVMARAEGWKGILVLTGVAREATGLPHDQTPDLVIDSLADVPAALRKLGGGGNPSNLR
ncbi:MAG: HAD-IIA family hydrolase [Actinomycetota bacterium]|nr:HAD-IIA family hydrolase [Actinomycetota bacterium]